MQSVVNIVTLKKPSQYFKKDITSIDESILENSPPTQLNTFSDAFDSFKKNLDKIEVLSEFSINVERVNHLSEKVEGIQQDIQSLLKKEDLDRAMMSQLLVVEQSIRDVQSKVKSINENKLTEIRLDVSSLTNSVSEFLEVEVPKYKKFIIDSELRTNNRYEELENDVNKTLEGIGEFVESEYQHLTETLQGINQQSLESILEDFRILDENFSKLKEEDIPRYKGFIVETERKTENKLEEINSQVLQSLSSFEEKIDINIEKNHSEISNIVESLEKKIVKFENKELPKYKKTIVESEKKTEEKLNEFNAVLERTVDSLMGKINLVEGNKVDLIKTVNDKIQEVVSLRDLVVDQLEKNESSRDDLKKKVTDLEIEIVRNESHIQIQNKNLEKIQEDVFSVIKSINLEEIEEKNYELSKKIKYLEEVFEKFNEKQILNESIVIEPPSTDNKDPLTSTDKNFVTLDQLQQHYRLFINRIQQQLATIGGGGETRLKYLDDIVGIATNASAYDGKFLKYNHTIGKFEFDTVNNIDTENIVSSSISITDSNELGDYYGDVASIQKAYITDTNSSISTSIHKQLSVDDFSTVEYTIQANSGIDITTTKIISVNNKSSINNVEIHSVSTGSTFVNYSINIEDNLINLVVTPLLETRIVYNILYNAIALPYRNFILTDENENAILTENSEILIAESY